MKKIWEAPMLETLGMDMTKQGRSTNGTDGLFTDANGHVLMGLSPSGDTGEVTSGNVEGPFEPITTP